MVDAASDLDPIVRNTEIEAARTQTLAATPRERRSDVRFVRRFIGAETGVAIDAKNRIPGFGHILRREFKKLAVQHLDELCHWPLYVLFEQVLSRLEPFTAIVAFQSSEEGNHLSRETRKRGWHGFTPLSAALG